MTKYLLRSGCVLTLGSRTQNHAEADVLIEGTRIAEIGPNLSGRGAEVIDASNAIVMPGFVDSHRHLWTSLFRHDGAASPLESSRLSADDIYAAALVGLLGSVEAGITTVVDWSDLPDGDGRREAALQAHADSGVRTVFLENGKVGPEAGDRTETSGSPGPRTTTAFGSADVTKNGAADLEASWANARREGLRIHSHAGMHPADEGAVATLAENGLLGSDVTLVHCSHVNNDDLDALSGSGASISIAPSTEMATGLGSPRLQRMLDRGIKPSLAIDDERIAPGDLFAQMRATNSIQHADYFELKLAGKAGLPNLLTTRDVIRYATSQGAVAAGLADVTGSLEPGKRADIVVLRTDRPNIFPINDPIGAVVWGMDSSNVDWVFVDGSALLREGTLTADIETSRSLAEKARDKVLAASRPTAGSTAQDVT